MSINPLKTFEDLLSWRIPDTCIVDSFYERNKQLYQSKHGVLVNNKKSFINKVLFCHDMKGGYIDDNESQNNGNFVAYRFYHWHLIDIFCYFSHHFVTIPPLAWIKLCQKNGVDCYGTIIVEPQMKSDILDRLLDNVDQVVDKLKQITEYYKLDGWLVNIECSIDETNKYQRINLLKEFLTSLTKNDIDFIWYDAITCDGELKWQNGLTSYNIDFYELSGRKIFTNYCWGDSELINTIKICDNQLNSIYVGIDCFGRGMIGGGQMNTCYALESMNRIAQHSNSDSKFSIALFAPGWTHECCPSNYSSIYCHADEFYSKITQYLLPATSSETYYRCLDTAFFSTDFHLSQSPSVYYEEGKATLSKSQLPYNLLGDQQYFPSGITDFQDVLKIIPENEKVAYNGYGCAKLIIQSDWSKCLTNKISIELFRLNLMIDSSRVLHFVIGSPRNSIDQSNYSIYLSISINKYSSINNRKLKIYTRSLKLDFESQIPANQISDDTALVIWKKFEINDWEISENETVILSIISLSVENNSASGQNEIAQKQSEYYLGHLSIV